MRGSAPARGVPGTYVNWEAAACLQLHLKTESYLFHRLWLTNDAGTASASPPPPARVATSPAAVTVLDTDDQGSSAAGSVQRGSCA